MSTPSRSLSEEGFALVDAGIPSELRQLLKKTAFIEGTAGSRCLLDQAHVADAARQLRQQLMAQGLLATRVVAIQAIAFDKTPDVNWKVAWHQDLMFPFAKPVSSPGYSLSCVKDGSNFARPPLEVLNDLLAVRLHLDDCHAAKGPLRVSPGTHRLGILPPDTISEKVRHHGQTDCLAREGECLVMRPLLLHASSKATESGHRRVLHFVFHSGIPTTEPWAQSV
jgi:ectoine hydroxylase-related dioxygenase (phytanoyl-CoA dioxygenase family)